MDNKEAADLDVQAVLKAALGIKTLTDAEIFERLEALYSKGRSDAIAALRGQGESVCRVHGHTPSWANVEILSPHELHNGQELYAAPPPVRVPDELTNSGNSEYRWGYFEGWNGCRAEVLRLNAAPSGWQPIEIWRNADRWNAVVRIGGINLVKGTFGCYADYDFGGNGIQTEADTVEEAFDAFCQEYFKEPSPPSEGGE